MKQIYQFSLLVLLSFFTNHFAVAAGSNTLDLEEWTGQHTRIVWVQDQGNGADTFARSKNLALYGYDSRDGKGERRLLEDTRNYFKPIFTPDGKKIIYSDRRDRQMYLFDWETGKVKSLGAGVAVAVWKDTEKSFFFKKSTIWVYCFAGLQPENKYGTSQPLYRFPLGKPKKKELVWNKTNMAWSNVQLSRDGKIIGGLFPWPHGGILKTDSKEFTRLGRGCWTSLSPDNSKLLWIFDGLHRNLQFHNVTTAENWKVNINSAPGIGGFEVYHPRWSNHPRYFVMTGPYKKGEGGNKIEGGGENVEIYLGRFDDKVQKVEDWFTLTSNRRADFYPDVWVASGEKYNLFSKSAGSEVKKVARIWPQNSKNMLFVWENMKASNQLSESSPIGFYQCNIALRGKALFSRDLSLETSGGWGETGDAGKKFGTALASSGKAAVELFVVPKKEQNGTLFVLKGSGGSGLLVRQEQDSLVVSNSSNSIKGAHVAWSNVFNAGEATHIVLHIAAGTVEAVKNGKSLGVQKISFDFNSFTDSELILGDKSGAWQGTISHVGLYQSLLSKEQLQNNSDYAFKKHKERKAVTPLVVEARLAEATEIPAPDSIGAYRRALVVNSYDVLKVVNGNYEDKKIVVAEWAVLDRQVIKKYADEPQVERLVLETFDDHPELEGERQMMDIFEPDLTMYYRLK